MRRRGFTLLEVLVTLVVVAMFSAAVYALFIRAVVDREYMEQSAFSWRAGQAILRQLEKDLTACPAAADGVAFSGTLSMSDLARLEFLSAVNGRYAGEEGTFDDLVGLTYEVEQGDDEGEGEGAGLYRIEETGGSTSAPGRTTRRLLARGVSAFTLEYHDGSGWVDQWQGSRPPRAVRVHLVLRRRLQINPAKAARDEDFPFSTVIAIPAGG